MSAQVGQKVHFVNGDGKHLDAEIATLTLSGLADLNVELPAGPGVLRRIPFSPLGLAFTWHFPEGDLEHGAL